MKRRLPLALVVLAVGCGGYWGRRPVDEPRPIDPTQPVWIWTNGGVQKWRAVVVTEDFVSGSPWKPRRCETCRRSIPRAQVDSILLGYKPLDEKIVEDVGTLAGAYAFMVAFCAVFGTRSGDAPCGGKK